MTSLANSPSGARRLLLFLAVALLAIPASAAAARNAHVTAGGGGSPGAVFVLDTATNAFGPASTPVGVLPLGVAITPDGGRAYVANSGLGPCCTFGDTVTPINTSTNSVIGGPITIGDGGTTDAPVGVAVTPDGTRAYVANLYGGTVSVIDTNPSSPTYNTVTATIAGLPGASPSPRGIAITPDGGRAYVAIAGSGAGGGGGVVARIDTNPSSGTYNTVVGGSIAVGGTPWIPGITPDGRKLYVPTAETNSVKVIDTNPSSPTYNTVTTTITSGTTNAYMVGVSPDGSRAYATSGSTLFGGPPPYPSSVAVIDTATDATTGSPMTAGSAPLGVAFTPDGSSAYVANGGDATMTRIDTATGGKSTIPLTGSSGGALGVAMPPSQGPVAEFTASAAPAGSATSFSASSADVASPGGVRFDWDFGDGTTAQNAGRTPSHTYANGGTYDVKLTVTADYGSTGGVFTGQTASVRQGAPTTATKTVPVTVQSTDAGVPTVTVTNLKKNQKIKRRKFKKVKGTASDPAGVSRVEYAISKKVGAKKATSAKKKSTKCRYLQKSGKLSKPKSCKKVRYLTAKGTTSWSARIKKVLPRGGYTLYVKATNTLGKVSEPATVPFRLT